MSAKSSTIIIKGVHCECKESELFALFQQHGLPCKKVKLYRDTKGSPTTTSKYTFFCYIDFESRSQAERAIPSVRNFWDILRVDDPHPFFTFKTVAWLKGDKYSPTSDISYTLTAANFGDENTCALVNYIGGGCTHSIVSKNDSPLTVFINYGTFDEFFASYTKCNRGDLLVGHRERNYLMVFPRQYSLFVINMLNAFKRLIHTGVYTMSFVAACEISRSNIFPPVPKWFECLEQNDSLFELDMQLKLVRIKCIPDLYPCKPNNCGAMTTQQINYCIMQNYQMTCTGNCDDEMTSTESSSPELNTSSDSEHTVTKEQPLNDASSDSDSSSMSELNIPADWSMSTISFSDTDSVGTLSCSDESERDVVPFRRLKECETFGCTLTSQSPLSSSPVQTVSSVENPTNKLCFSIFDTLRGRYPHKYFKKFCMWTHQELVSFFKECGYDFNAIETNAIDGRTLLAMIRNEHPNGRELVTRSACFGGIGLNDLRIQRILTTAKYVDDQFEL